MSGMAVIKRTFEKAATMFGHNCIVFITLLHTLSVIYLITPSTLIILYFGLWTSPTRFCKISQSFMKELPSVFANYCDLSPVIARMGNES